MNNTNIAKKIDQLIKNSNNILIVGHTSPDPDALSSVIALQEIIINHYQKKVQAICEKTPDKLNFIPGYSDVIHNSLLNQIKTGGHDLVIFVDFNQWHMTSRQDNELIKEEFVMQQIPTIIIDHHPKSGATIQPDLYFIEDTTSAAANIHVIFHEILGLEILPKVAEHLLIGVLSDTNRFKYRYSAKTEATILERSAELIKHSPRGIEQISIDLGRIQSNSLDTIAVFMMNIKIVDENTAYTTLSEEDMDKFDLDSRSLGDASLYIASNVLNYVDSVKRGFMIYPRLVEDGTFTVRFRSNAPEYPVNQWAEELGGGGHPQSAAALIKANSIEDAEDKILEVVNSV